MMIGIYKIENIKNGKIYIGQSNDIERRLKEHCYPNRYKTSRNPVDVAIHKYGKENFIFDIIEECQIEELNEKEKYWISFYDSYKKGYNCNIGGDQASIGQNNGRAKLTEQDVIMIRTAYQQHKTQKEVFESLNCDISWDAFQCCWQGRSWTHIMPEVFTEENRNYYIYENSIGSKGGRAVFSDEEVEQLRRRYQTETAKEIYEDYKDRVCYETLQSILCGYSYKNVKIYGKMEPAFKHLSAEQVIECRTYYMTHSCTQTYEHFDYLQDIKKSMVKKILEGSLFKDLPIYSKKQHAWINS